jgi:hypothetical protein
MRRLAGAQSGRRRVRKRGVVVYHRSLRLRDRGVVLALAGRGERRDRDPNDETKHRRRRETFHRSDSLTAAI